MDKTQYCHAWLKAWTLRDVEMIAAFYTDDLNYSDPGVIRPISSKQDFKLYLQKLIKVYPEWEWTAKEVHETPTGFACTWVAHFLVEQKTVLVEGMDLVVLRGSLIERNEVYFNLSKITKPK